MKKLAAIILTLILLATSCLNAFANDYDVIHTMSFCPSQWSEQTSADAVTRAELCYVAVRLFENALYDPCDTVFDDVKSDNLYSGYIHRLYELGVVSGVSEAMFNPGDTVDAVVASKVILTLLGYDKIAEYLGGYPDGYTQTAERADLLDGVKNYSELSQADLCTLAYNVLTSVKNYAISCDDDSLNFNATNDMGTLAERGISVYRGQLGRVYDDYASFVVEENQFKNQANTLTRGTLINIDIKNVNAAEFENAPVVLWINKNNEALYVGLQEDIEIHVGYAATVNGQSNKNKEFQTEKLYSMYLLDDKEEYDLSSATVRYNGKEQASAPYVNKFVRIVAENDEVISADFYNTTGGGLISKVNSSKVTYNNGKNKNAVFSKFDDSEVLRVYIDGRYSSISEIKPNSVFSYYQDSENLILSVSEVVVVDELKGVSDSELFIGNYSYNKGEKVFCALSGDDYIEGELNKLFGYEVIAYVAPNGDVTFVSLSQSGVAENEFYGILIAYEENYFHETVDFKLYRLGDEITEKIYTVDKHTDFESGLSINDLKNKCSNLNGEGIYRFQVNSKGTIRNVSTLDAFAGFGENCEVTLTSFINDATPHVIIGEKVVFFPDENIIALFEINGRFLAKKISWQDLYGGGFETGVNMRLYAENQSSKPSLITLTGDGISSLYTRHGYKVGFITDKRSIIDEKGEDAYSITMFSKYDSGEHIVTRETGESLPQNGYVTYQNSGLLFTDDNIVFNTVTGLTGSSDLWPEENGLRHGIVKELDDTRLWVEENDEIFFLHPYDCFFGKLLDTQRGKRFEAVSVNEIAAGDRIIYAFYGGDIKAIIAVE